MRRKRRRRKWRRGQPPHPPEHAGTSAITWNMRLVSVHVCLLFLFAALNYIQRPCEHRIRISDRHVGDRHRCAQLHSTESLGHSQAKPLIRALVTLTLENWKLTYASNS